MDHARSPLLLTGATGYVGGRLLRALEAEGRPVRCLARNPERLAGRVGADTEVVKGDVLTGDLADALRGVECAFYLVHALGSTDDFEEEEFRGARNFAAAAREAGVQRIVYLGGLAREDETLSAHLRSRHEVGRILRESGAVCIEFRASMVIGSGSLSFELVRALVRHVPFMIVPKWGYVKAQPIAITDVIAYLTAAIDLEASESRVFEIGGAEAMSYADILRLYAKNRGIRRFLVPVPFLTPRLSSYWLHLVTPLYASAGRKLIDSAQHATVVHDPAARDAFPEIEPMSIADAIAQARRKEDQEFAETHWADAISAFGPRPSFGGVTFQSRIVDSRCVLVDDISVADAFAVVQRIGGRTGWYYGTWLWKVRGLLDRLVGGVGMARGRRDPQDLRVGDVVDCWRVEAVEPNERIVFFAEMLVPGRAWLTFETTPAASGNGVHVRQTAVFDPIGVFGLLYWYALYIPHGFIFSGMLRNIGFAAGREAGLPAKARVTFA